MRRRKMIVAIVALASLSGFIGWRTYPRMDPRLVGTWVETHDRYATAEEIARARDPVQFSARTKWSFRADGSGTVANLRMGGTGAGRWRTQGDQLFMRHVSEDQSLSEELVELWNVLAGARRRRWREFQTCFDDA